MFWRVVLLCCAVLPLWGKDLVSAWAVNAGPLHPHLYTPNQMYAQVLVYQSLVRYGKNGIIEPEIASSWEISPDGKTYTFMLPPDAKFSDGSALDAMAVAKNFENVMRNKERHQWLGIVDVIESFDAPNATQFVLRLKHPYAATLEELSLPRPFRILAPSGFATNPTKIKKPIGSGPWQLDETVLGVHDIFVPNPYYRGKKSSFDRLVVKVIPDPNARVLALESGAVDILIGREILSVENFVRLSKNAAFATHKSDNQGTSVIVLNATYIAPHVRRAIAHAFNKDAVLKNILLDVEPRADTLFDPALPYAQQNLTPVSFDTNKARALLGDSKHNYTITYLGTNPTQKAIAEALQGDLAKVGISLELLAKEHISYYQNMRNGDFQMIFNETWGNPFEPHSFVGSMLHPSHADFAAQKDLPNKAQLDERIRHILSNNDKKILEEDYAFVLQSLHESGVYLPISTMPVLAVYHKDRVKDFEFGQMRTEFMFHLLSPVE